MGHQADRELIHDTIVAVLKSNLSKDKNELSTIFRDLLKEPLHIDTLNASIGFVFDFFYARAAKSLQPPPSLKEINSRAESKMVTKRADAEEVEIVKAAITSRILDMQTMVGKPLRDCTGAECVKMGGFFAQIGRTVSADQTVGAVLSENDLKGLVQKMWPVGSSGHKTRNSNQTSKVTPA